MKIYLIRHGESEGNVAQENGQCYHGPDHEIRLTEKGVEQARQAGEILEKDLSKSKYAEPLYIYISPYKRTLQTFIHMTKNLFKADAVNIEPLIREQEWQSFKDFEEEQKILAERAAYSKFYYRFENGESIADTYQRAVTFVNKLKLDYLLGRIDGNVVIFTHQVTMTMLTSALLDIDASLYEEFPKYKNCQILKFDFKKDKTVLISEDLASEGKNEIRG